MDAHVCAMPLALPANWAYNSCQKLNQLERMPVSDI